MFKPCTCDSRLDVCRLFPMRYGTVSLGFRHRIAQTIYHRNEFSACRASVPVCADRWLIPECLWFREDVCPHPWIFAPCNVTPVRASTIDNRANRANLHSAKVRKRVPATGDATCNDATGGPVISDSTRTTTSDAKGNHFTLVEVGPVFTGRYSGRYSRVATGATSHGVRPDVVRYSGVIADNRVMSSQLQERICCLCRLPSGFILWRAGSPAPSNSQHRITLLFLPCVAGGRPSSLKICDFTVFACFQRSRPV